MRARSSISAAAGSQPQLERPVRECSLDHLAHQRVEVDRLALQRRVAGGQPLAFEQVADQVAHLAQVAQQRGALGCASGVGSSSALSRARVSGERSSWLMRQQQRALGVEHAAGVVRPSC